MKYLTILILLFITLLGKTQENCSYSKMQNILSFNKYIQLHSSSIESLKDTVEFLENIIDYYKNINNQYTRFIDFYGKDVKNAYITNDNNIAISDKGSISIEKYTKTNFAVLFFIENIIIGSNDTLLYIKVKNKKIIDAVVDISMEYRIKYEHYSFPKYSKKKKFEEKEIKKIYKYYKKWLQIVKEKGLEYVKKNNIRPLNNSKYTWISCSSISQ